MPVLFVFFMLLPAPAAASPVSEVALFAAPLAQRPPTDSIAALEALTSEAAAGLRCPVCQGLSIEDSPTELALEMRAVVRDQLAAGRTPAEVRAYYVSKYGEWILLQPKAEGFNLMVYLLPIMSLLLGGGVVVLAVRRWTRQGGELAEGEPQAEPDHA
jgi:cytochrome c-type biogenesis protein CcmH